MSELTNVKGVGDTALDAVEDIVNVTMKITNEIVSLSGLPCRESPFAGSGRRKRGGCLPGAYPK